MAFAIRYDRSVDRVDDCCHRRLPTRIGVEDTTSQPFRKALAAPASYRAGTALFRAWTSTVASLGPTIHAALPYHRDWAYPPG